MIKFKPNLPEQLRAKARKDWENEEIEFIGEFETYLAGYIAAIKRDNMSDALDYVRNNCGIAGEEVAEMVDALERQRDELQAEADFQRNAHSMAQQALLEQGQELAAVTAERDELIRDVQRHLAISVEVLAERDELKTYWFDDADPSETKYADEYAISKLGADKVRHETLLDAHARQVDREDEQEHSAPQIPQEWRDAVKMALDALEGCINDPKMRHTDTVHYATQDAHAKLREVLK